MELIRGIGALQDCHRGCVLTIGNFDGVHLGHRAVLRQVTDSAAKLRLPSTVMVFEPTPLEYFRRAEAPARLTNLREKVCALDDTGVSRVLCVRFDRRMAAMSPAAFIDELLIEALDVRHLIVGDDFRFGHQRRGDFAMLRAAGKAAGFRVDATPSFIVDGVRVSSSAVRAALARHDLETAGKLLGRRYSMKGRVRRGRQLGRKLGYPTANIDPRRQVLPLGGVFAVRVHGVDTAMHPGVASLGTRPAVDGREPLLEVHLFDFDRSLYGQWLEVEFVARLRDEQHFDTLPAMVQQMHRDAAAARRILSAPGGGEA